MTTNKQSIIFGITGVVVFLAVLLVWRTGALNNFLPFILTMDGWNKHERERNNPVNGGNQSTLTEAEAQDIAQKSCIKGGDTLSSGGIYNPNSKTWWFDANLNAAREGCNPACVVSEETKAAEINWRCTGLIAPGRTDPVMSPASRGCGIENCHGLDIVCGPSPAQMCADMYQLGDKCRQYAECRVVAGMCRQLEDPRFTACKSCVQRCEQNFPDDPVNAFECESECGE